MLGFRYVNIVSIVICIWIDLIPISFFHSPYFAAIFFSSKQQMNDNNEKQQPIYLTHGVCVYFVNGSNCVHLSTATELYYTLWYVYAHVFNSNDFRQMEFGGKCF